MIAESSRAMLKKEIIIPRPEEDKIRQEWEKWTLV
jgi:hypothetical protein